MSQVTRSVQSDALVNDPMVLSGERILIAECFFAMKLTSVKG